MVAQLKESHQSSHIQIVRRNGKKAPLDIDKIRKVIEWACEGITSQEVPEGNDAIPVSPIALEAGLTAQLKEGITTKEIQNNLIDCALKMCSPEVPEWRFVSARLKLWSLYKNIKVARGYGYYLDDKIVPFLRLQSSTSYALWIFDQIGHQKWDSKAEKWVSDPLYDERLREYSNEDLLIAGSWIVPDRDKDYDDAGMNLWICRYLLPNELPQEAILTCALLLALPEEKENRLKVAKQFYDAISLRKLSLATPILGNLRIPNGSLTSCFIDAMDDNLESIFAVIRNTAQISKNGGGVGVNVSRIRAVGSWVMKKVNASGGVIPWIKLLNDTAIAVNQGKLLFFCPSVA
jgi:ribonucleoside-diphosphate reductase alpha chain